MKEETRLKICKTGNLFLKIFLSIMLITLVYFVGGFLDIFPGKGFAKEHKVASVVMLVLLILLEASLFWIGIIMVYVSSVQLGVKHRVWGILLGWIPILNIVMLTLILRITDEEVRYEKEKLAVNYARAGQKVCETKYPILMVHGVFFRDLKHFNYWGRIPAELEKNGARIFYGNHNSAASVADSAKELEQRVLDILRETGAEKINVIAHSKGGLDSRCAIATTSIAPYIASLTTINTPHRGCEFADFLLHKIPEKQKQMVAKSYNTAATKIGDTNPDFLAAVYDLTSENCKAFNDRIFDDPNVYYQSFGSKLNYSVSGKFPLNFSYQLVKHFDGANDGLVGEKSFPWGSRFEFLTVKGKRGISHGDVIDLNRENIREFDVREFYVKVVSELKSMGF